jgi:hypothetical protein
MATVREFSHIQKGRFSLNSLMSQVHSILIMFLFFACSLSLKVTPPPPLNNILQTIKPNDIERRVSDTLANRRDKVEWICEQFEQVLRYAVYCTLGIIRLFQMNYNNFN